MRKKGNFLTKCIENAGKAMIAAGLHAKSRHAFVRTGNNALFARQLKFITGMITGKKDRVKVISLSAIA